MRRPCHVAVLAAIAALAGCGNAYEHLSMGEWREIGEAQPPVLRNEQFIVTTIVPGEGAPVRAGDLVKAWVAVTTVDISGSTRDNPNPQVVWIWTGRDPQDNAQSSGRAFATYGMVGGARPRAALIGRQLHEQFEIHLDAGADEATGDLPVRGIIDDPFSRLRAAGMIKGQLVGPLEWPAAPLRGNGGGSPSARIEILEICRAAKLYRRTAMMTQFGKILSLADVRYANHRKGTLGWTAIDAQCPAPDGHVRFQAGPFYYSDIEDVGLLADWSASYIGLRPPEEHPEEWQVDTGR